MAESSATTATCVSDRLNGVVCHPGRRGALAFNTTLTHIHVAQPILALRCAMAGANERPIPRDSSSLAFFLHGSIRQDRDIYVMINTNWNGIDGERPGSTLI